MKNNYFLDLHKEWMWNGRLPDDGLCYCIDNHKNIFNLFIPTEDELDVLDNEGLDRDFWASGLSFSGNVIECCEGYTPLRQTIILFCHEILNS